MTDAAALPPLPLPVPGTLHHCDGPAGRVAWYDAGPPAGTPPAPPLLLVHSVNAAASAAEVRPVFETWAARRRVIAFDLPGYGHSERAARRHSPRGMTDAVHQVLAAAGGGPVDALALSLGCEFLARAAAERPAGFLRLALVSPTGLQGRQRPAGAPGSTREVPGLYRVLAAPWWRQGLFNRLTRPGVVRYFLKRTWGSPDIDEAMWAYAVRTAREPDALWAPLDFLSGALFSADVRALYDALTMPVWMAHGVRGDFTDYRGAQPLLEGGRWQRTVLPTGAIPWFEVPQQFDAGLSAFLADSPAG